MMDFLPIDTLADGPAARSANAAQPGAAQPVAAQPNVVLVSMPWINLIQPALGLAALRGHLDREGIGCRVYHANLDILAFISVRTYGLISDLVGINEFLFTAVLQPELDEKQLVRLLEQCQESAGRKCNDEYPAAEDLARLFVTLRQHVVPAYLAQCAERILAMQPSLVGFTCMFDQTIASVALAKLLKEAAPDLMVALGGYAVQHENGLEVLKAFPWIDCIAHGEGEPVIADLAWASVGARNPGTIKGIVVQGRNETQPIPPAPRWNLRQSAFPNFDDWFADLKQLNDTHRVRIESPYLLMESSRGCWWGQKHHCVFCGIDDDTMKYRSKSSQQVLDELASLRERYGERIAVRFSDYILPFDFYRELLPMLEKQEPRYELEAEIKANQKQETVRAFAQAGFVGLQPGIESFSSSVLRKIDKGTTALHNVQLLKWGFENQIEIQYNLLVGFPDDDPEDYREMVRMVPRLYHLTPPSNFSLVAVTRFAPLHLTPDRFGHAVKPRHHTLYDLMFSDAFLAATNFNLDEYCYNFDRYFENGPEIRKHYTQLGLQVEAWKESHQKRNVFLSHKRSGDSVLFVDTRFGQPEKFRLDGLAAQIYTICSEEAAAPGWLAERTSGGQALHAAIAELEERRVIWQSDGKIFGLGIASEVVARNIASNFKWQWTAIGRAA